MQSPNSAKSTDTATKARETSAMELILLFTGDDFSKGAASTRLAEAICWSLNPDSLSDLRMGVFGALDNDHISEFELMVLERGFKSYETKRKKGLA